MPTTNHTSGGHIIMHDHDDTCDICGHDYPRSNLAWHADKLECPNCTAARETPRDLDLFVRSYIECALWSSTTDDGCSALDADYDHLDLTPNAIASMTADCAAFVQSGAATLATLDATDEQHGHDFWLTRNGHGAGFWDRGYGAAGDDLTRTAKTFGSSDLYVGDDGRIHVS